MHCLNCDKPLLSEHQFCPACGQKTSTERLQLKSIAADVLQVVTDADRGFFSLIWQLIWRPGIVARAYVEGHRKSLFPPFNFLFLVVGMVAFFVWQTHFISVEPSLTFKQETAGQKILPKIIQLIEENYNLILIISVPTFAMWNRIFFTNSRLYYAEHLILASYVLPNFYAFSYLIIKPSIMLFPEFKGTLKGLDFFLFIFYSSWANRQFLRISGWQNLVVSFFPPILTRIFPFILVVFLIIVGMILGVEMKKSRFSFSPW